LPSIQPRTAQSERIRCGLASVVVLLASATPAAVRGEATLGYRIEPVATPTEPISVSLVLTSDAASIAAIGARLSYDASRVTLSTAMIGSAVPASWDFVYLETGEAGSVDAAIVDTTAAPVTIDRPTTAPVLTLVFSRVDDDPSPVAFGFNDAAPVTAAERAAFPANHYVITVAPSLSVQPATTEPATGPGIPPLFVRGDSNGDSHVDIGDAITALLHLFAGASIACAKSADIDDDGRLSITDPIALLDALFDGGAPISPPFPACGRDATPDELPCTPQCAL